MFNFVSHRRKYFIFSSLLVVLSILSLSLWGLRLGIDFKGGTLMMIEVKDSQKQVESKIKEISRSLNLGEISVQSTQGGIMVRLKHISSETHQEILNLLKKDFPQIEEKSYQTVGPTIGRELEKKALWSIGFALILIIFYITWSFRKVSSFSKVSSWKYGLAAILALIHDLLIVLGIFSVAGHFLKTEVNSFFIVALLTTLGYSVHDTIVVFDRIRERVLLWTHEAFEETVNQSINQTLARSINTSLTVLFVLIFLFLLGDEAIRVFTLALIFGIIVGTYSSIFIASPLLIIWQKKNQ